jgi:hypothetical protein
MLGRGPTRSRRYGHPEFRRGIEAVAFSKIFEGVGPAWIFLLAVLFVGVVYWAFRPRRSRPRDDDPA